MSEVACYHLAALPLEMQPDLEAIEGQWRAFFSGLERPARIFSRTTRFDLKGPRQHLQGLLRSLDAAEQGYTPLAEAVEQWMRAPQPAAPAPPVTDGTVVLWEEEASGSEQVHHLAATLPPPLREALDAVLPPERRQSAEAWRQALLKLGRPFWRRRWLEDYAKYYQLLQEQVELRGLEHSMLCWLPDGVLPQQQAGEIARAFGTPARLADLTPLLRGEYDEAPDCLIPIEPHLPYIALLSADDLLGTWSLWTLARLIDLPIDLHICIDVVPMDPFKAAGWLDLAAAAHENAAAENPRDKKAARKSEAANYYQEQAEQGFHELRLVIAVEGRDKASLDAAVRTVIKTAAPFMRLIRPPCGQGPLAQFFTTTPTSDIDAFVNARIEISHGAAVTMPLGIRRPSRTDGIMWLIEGETPICFNPMRDAEGRRRAGHMVIIGKTSFGKTFAMMVWAMRMLALGWQVVVFEPQGHARHLIRACGAGGAYHKLNLHQQINVLDVVVARNEDGDRPSLAQQILQVLNQLAVLLGSADPTAEGEADFRARSWTNLERGLLDQALRSLYKPWADNLDRLRSEETPILADLVAELLKMPVSERLTSVRDTLVDEIDLYLVQGSLGEIYNGRTTVRWDFESDATAYDLRDLGDGTPRILFMMQALGALNRYVRNRPDRERPLIVIFDEFAYTMGQAPTLARFCSDAAKTWRTFSAALITMDQDSHTYLGTRGAVASGPLKSIWDNATIKAIFKQDPEPAERLLEFIEGLQSTHVERIKTAGIGDCVLCWNGDDDNRQVSEVFGGRVIGTAMENRHFKGRT